MTTHRQSKHRRLLQISKAEQITAYSPSQDLIDAAQERTIGMVEYFRIAIRDADWKKEWEYQERLARSCYLQGAQDAALVAAQLQRRGSADEREQR
jgi:hypothetical protein